jgi:hypothetical protein
MPRTIPPIRHYSRGFGLLGFVLKATATGMASLTNWQRTVSIRRAIADLPADRLKDIDHAEAPTPVIEVKAGLITTLISMR